MKHATNCKFCKKPITIEVDDDYSKTEDVYKLIPLAACNTCADLRVEKRSLEARVRHLCMGRFHDKKWAEAKKDIHRAALDKLLKQYANMIARWHRMDGMAWDDECLELVMDKPEHWNLVMAELWKHFKHYNPQPA